MMRKISPRSEKYRHGRPSVKADIRRLRPTIHEFAGN
jgi:hypothetical protein